MSQIVRLQNEDGTQEWMIPVKDTMPDIDMDVESKYTVEVSLLLFLDLAERAYGMVPVLPQERDIVDIIKGVQA